MPARLAVQVVGPLGRQVQHIAAETDGSPHGDLAADPYLGGDLRVGRRGEGGKSIQRLRRSPGDLQLRRMLHPPSARLPSTSFLIPPQEALLLDINPYHLGTW